MAVSVPLCNGPATLVDEVDAHLLQERHFYAVQSGANRAPYVRTTDNQYLHRLIMNAPKGLQVDHINHDTLDNRRSNLRVVSRSRNISNGRYKPGRSGFRCVHIQTNGAGYMFELTVDGKRYRKRGFPTAQCAALAYDERALELLGPLAILNFPKTEEQSQ